MLNKNTLSGFILRAPLEIEVYKIWRKTLYEMLGETKGRAIEKKVIEKLARVLCNSVSQELV